MLIQFFFLLQCSVIFTIILSHFNELSRSLCYSAQPFFTTTVFMHPHCYNSQLFFTATVLNYFLLLQCSTIPYLLQCSVIPCCYKMTKRRRGHAGRLVAWSGRLTGGRWLMAGAQSPDSVSGWTVEFRVHHTK
jgi:hypothetical protein